MYTDLKPLLDSIASSKQVDTKMMRPIIHDMKERLIDQEIRSFKWIKTKNMISDILTKEKMSTEGTDDVVYNNIYRGILEDTDQVVFTRNEVKMECILKAE